MSRSVMMKRRSECWTSEVWNSPSSCAHARILRSGSRENFHGPGQSSAAAAADEPGAEGNVGDHRGSLQRGDGAGFPGELVQICCRDQTDWSRTGNSQLLRRTLIVQRAIMPPCVLSAAPLLEDCVCERARARVCARFVTGHLGHH